MSNPVVVVAIIIIAVAVFVLCRLTGMVSSAIKIETEEDRQREEE